ncbi:MULTISPECIES: antibiotic acetyltransferase [unclassified Campylobacter]|uniref:antibiotic acetyltransferase n=1 Tax=unclassified Campylobacter TaxID=2593542 RepID=UPI001238304F|nr:MULTISPECIES: antibiotic acetyltransferase [unclassified Campylobacter]KAA6228454.1 antibiotic acetyltransferase [Campylobacter sp. LR185c]KAA6229426.1 antibiotic acetyltransferase [Campylobacter sp. LR286c]KAA6234105.1 antibiotic acetyltransferase [Campylobacter sp. LR291e]
MSGCLSQKWLYRRIFIIKWAYFMPNGLYVLFKCPYIKERFRDWEMLFYSLGLKFYSHSSPFNLISTSSFTYGKNAYIFKYNNLKYGNNEFKTTSHNEFVLPPAKTIVKDDVYLCTNPCLKPGITLNTGCVVAQNSLVTKDVPHYAVVGSNPARILKYRFDKKTIQRLLRFKWWLYNFVDFKNINLKTDINVYLDEVKKGLKISKYKF